MKTIVDVVIVSFRCRELLKDCLASLARSTSDVQLRVVVVDNASHDGTVSMVRERFPWVEVKEQAGNFGFARSVNCALEECSGDFVLLLNPDTRLEVGVLERLLAKMRVEPSIGMIGCRLVRSSGEFDHASKRDLPSRADAISYVLNGILRWDRRPRYLAPDVDEFGCGDVGAISGAFMLVRRTAVLEVGLLDERYWMYGEDLDWCNRFWRQNHRIHYCGNVSILHVKGGSAGKIRGGKTNWHFHRSLWLYYRDYLSHDSLSDTVVLGGIAASWFLQTCRYAAWFLSSKIRQE